MNLLRIPQDFLVLELKPFSLRYLYSGYDGFRPEVLDFGCYDFESHSWPDLFLSFAGKLRRMAREKLPPYSQLETYLILPAEMAVQSRILSFDYPGDEIDDWDDWELSQTLAGEDDGYCAEFLSSGSQAETRLHSYIGAAVRNRHINTLDTVLKSNSMFFSGVFLPQALWKEILDRIMGSSAEICLIYREDNSHLFIHHSSSGFPRMKWYQQRKCDENDPDKIGDEVIRNLAENLMYSLPYGNDGAHPPLYFFQDSFSHEETLLLEKILEVSLHDISGDILPDREYSPGQIEYLMPFCAHKKIGGAIAISRIIERT